MKNKALLLGLLLLGMGETKAQFVEDALRYSGYNGAISARASGFGVAYHGVADDGAAIFYNPAGLTLIGMSEVNAGLGFSGNNPDINFLGSKSNFSSNTGLFNNLSVTSLVSVGENRAAVGIGYFLENDYNATSEFTGFNTNSSYVANQATLKEQWVKDAYLAEANFKPKVTNNVQQYSFIREKGGLHNLTGAAGFDLNSTVALGFSITGKWGTYDYSKNYIESDPGNLHKTFNYDDFDKINIDETLTQTVSAITAAVGAQFRIDDFMRVGFTIKLPSSYSVSEDFNRNVSVLFDKDSVGIADKVSKSYPGTNSYTIYTPFVYCAGASFHSMGLTVSAGMEYTDLSQMEFSDSQLDFSAVNKDIIKNMTGRLSWGLGAEYRIPVAPVIVRAGLSQISSPYSKELVDSKVTNISLGASIIAGTNLRIDAAFKAVTYEDLRVLYGSSDEPSTYNYYTVKNKPVTFSIGVTYRY